MNTDRQPDDSDDSQSRRIEENAALWVLRVDRGLNAVEQDDYSQWLASDPRHREAVALQRWGWEELDRLAGLQTTLHAVPNPDLLAAPSSSWRKIIRILSNYNPKHLQRINVFARTTVSSLLLGALVWYAMMPERKIDAQRSTDDPSHATANTLSALIKQRTLPDGSTVELNRGAVVETQFTPAERRVRLVRGEANFVVTKNPSRPFIVSAGGVEVRAVGTVFNVRLGDAAVEVLVSEGKVAVAKVDIVGGVESNRAEPRPVEAGQSAIISRAPTEILPVVATLSRIEIEEKMAWQPRMLDFTDEPLSRIVAEFNRRNPVQLILDEAALASLRLSATFRSDNVEGFVRLMESDFGVQAKRRGETEITLRKAASL